MTMSTTTETIEARPFIKWAGGKRSLMSELLARVPVVEGRYFEPFLGGGALFYALVASGRIKRATLNDANERLVKTYRAIKRDPEPVLRKLTRMRNEESFYLRQRARDIDGEDDETIAAWMIYLNRTCFNGLYRVNRAGKFNVPFGGYENPRIVDRVNLEACSRALQCARIRCGDFMAAIADARAGDFVYFDPPYAPRVGHEFTSYHADGFTWNDHIRLRDIAFGLKARGVSVLLSNSGGDDVRELYARGFKVEEVWGQRSVGATGLRRGRVPDLLIS